jgi:DNA-binding transcriptional regulator YdaS (Cro superfamily)
MDGMALIRAERGLMAKIAMELGITRGAVATWRRIPAERVAEVSRITGISRLELRPDLYEAPSAHSRAAA